MQPDDSDRQLGADSSTAVSAQSSAPAKQRPVASNAELGVDLVIVFDAGTSRTALEAATSDYKRLLDLLSKQGLQAVGRAGAKDSGEILILVRAPEDRLLTAVEHERRSDWLHGVSSTRPDPRRPRDFTDDPLSSADRIRLVHDLITAAAPVGAGVTIGKNDFARVKSIFAPHDVASNKRWLADWTSANHTFRIPQSELDRVKDIHGESVALYFSFLRSYTVALVVPAAFGSIAWLFGAKYSILYAVLLSLWSLVFVEGWRLRERALAVRWGVKGCRTVGRRRADFKADVTVEDPATGEKVPSYTWWRRDARVLANVPVLIGFAAGLGLLITTIFTIETIINEVYDGPGKRYLSLLPTVLFAGIVPQVLALWQQTAQSLTVAENHALESDFTNNLTLKVFALNALVSYGSLLLSAYLYIPFGQLAIPRVISFLQGRAHIHVHSSKFDSRAYGVNSERLPNTLIALSTTTQIIGAVTEVFVPLAMRYATNEVKQRRGGKSDSSSTDASPEATFLRRIRAEAALPEFTLFAEYAEMTSQFGYVVLWSVIWPLVPLCALVNNFFELRGDVFKICHNVRRPIPTRSDTIGPWLNALGAMTWLGAISSASLIYLYRPRPHLEVCTWSAVDKLSSAVNATAAALNVTTPIGGGASTSPSSVFATTRVHEAVSQHSWSASRRTMLIALLVALASEHGYLAARIAVRYLLDRALWRHSAPARQLAERDGVVKREYMSALGIPDVEKRSEKAPATGGGIFEQGDRGIEELQSLLKKD